MGDITLLIEQARDGDRAAFDRLFEKLYPELRAVAHRRLGRHARAAIPPDAESLLPETLP